MVARIGPVGPDPDTGSLALLTYRTILFHMSGLLLLIHGDWLPCSHKKLPMVKVPSWILMQSWACLWNISLTHTRFHWEDMNSEQVTGTRLVKPEALESKTDDGPTGAEQLYRNYLKARKDWIVEQYWWMNRPCVPLQTTGTHLIFNVWFFWLCRKPVRDSIG